MLMVGVIMVATSDNDTMANDSDSEFADIDGEYRFNAMNEEVERFRHILKGMQRKMVLKTM